MRVSRELRTRGFCSSALPPASRSWRGACAAISDGEDRGRVLRDAVRDRPRAKEDGENRGARVLRPCHRQRRPGEGVRGDEEVYLAVSACARVVVIHHRIVTPARARRPSRSAPLYKYANVPRRDLEKEATSFASWRTPDLLITTTRVHTDTRLCAPRTARRLRGAHRSLRRVHRPLRHLRAREARDGAPPPPRLGARLLDASVADSALIALHHLRQATARLCTTRARPRSARRCTGRRRCPSCAIPRCALTPSRSACATPSPRRSASWRRVPRTPT